MASDNPAILLKQISFGYDRAKPVVREIDASLQPGRLTVLAGPNAAGKTTLLRLMLGLVRPWTGGVEVGGQGIETLTAQARARQVSYVPQRPGVRFAFTVRQVVAMGALAQGRGKAELVDRVIEDAGLVELSERVFAELSGGQQQRVMLARAQVQSAGGGVAMLLDEPGSHLDLHHRHATMQRLQALAAGGLAVLVVLHDLDLAVRYADDAWLMDRGRLVAAGCWDQVLTPEKLSPVYRLGLRQIDTGADRPMLAVTAGGDATMWNVIAGPASN